MYVRRLLILSLCPAGVRNTEERQSYLSTQAIIVNILKTFFQARPLLYAAFQHYMDKDESNQSASPIDLWIIYALSSSVKLRSKLHTLVAKKVGNGSLDPGTISASIHGLSVALEAVFPGMLSLAQGMMAWSRVGNMCIHAQHFAVVLYEQLYWEFTSPVRYATRTRTRTRTPTPTPIPKHTNICVVDKQQQHRII